jgi:hypothetical protein
MTADSIATIVAGVLGLTGVLIGTWAGVRIKRSDDRRAAELEELRSKLSEEQNVRSELRAKRMEAEAAVSRYREPLVSAAFDLQARVYNLCSGQFFALDRSSYHIDHTLYVFAQYLGWREIIRHEIQFLDLGDTPATKDLAELLEGITTALSVTRSCLPANFKLFRGEQRAAGEKMMLSADRATQAPMRYRCLGYASFVEALKQPDFNVWFSKLRNSVDYLESAGEPDLSRLILLQNALIDLIDFLDPGCVRFPRSLRNRRELPAEVAAVLRR